MYEPLDPTMDTEEELAALRARVAELERERKERIEAQNALRRSEERFRLLAENIPGVIYLCRNDERYSMLYLNDQVEQLTGYPKSAFLDDEVSFVDLYHPEDADSIAPRVEAALDERRPFDLIYRLRHRDGTWRWVQEVGVGVFRDGRLDYLEGVLNDITERTEIERRLLASEEQYQRIFETVRDGLGILSLDGRLLECNTAFHEMHGLSRDEMLEGPIKRIIHPDSHSLFDEFVTHIRAGEPYTCEAVDLKADGSPFDIEVHGYPFRYKGEPSILAIARDITPRKRDEQRLRESEEQYRAVFEANRDGVGIFDFDTGRLIEINTAYHEMHHCTREEFLALRPDQFVHPDSLHLFGQFIEEVQAGRVFHCEAQNQLLDGTPLEIEVYGCPFQFRGRLHALAVVRDITKRKAAERALRRSEQRYHALTSLSPVGIFQADEKGHCIYVNERGCQMSGRPREQCIGEGWLKTIHPEDLAMVRREWRKMIETGETFRCEYRLRQPSDKVVWGIGEARPIRDDDGQVIGFVGTVTDITERVLMESKLRALNADLEARVELRTRALRESEQRYRTLIRNVPGVIYRCECDADWTMRYVSDDIQHLVGYAPSYFIGSAKRTFASVIHPDDRDQVQQIVEDAVRRDQPFDLNYRVIHRDGTVRWVFEKGQPIRDESGRLDCLDGAIFDITAHHRAQAEIDRIYELSPELLCIADLNGYFLRVNPAFSRVLGYPEKELLSRPYLDFVHPDDIEPSVVQMKRSERGDPIKDYQNRYIAADGSIRWLSWSAITAADEGLVYAAARDVTALNEADARVNEIERELAHVGRLATMGELATSLAHELNQPLYAVCNFIQGCILRLEAGTIEPPQLVDTLRQIVAQAERAGQIIKRLRQFVRKRPPSPTSLDITDVIREATSLIEHEARHAEVPVRFDFADNLPPVLADRILIEQVIVNLLRNSIEAIVTRSPKRRRVTVRARATGSDAVSVEVADTGGGIPDDLADRIFEAFHTSKDDGIGIGLSISRSIIESHNGSMALSHNNATGATFCFTLPTADAQA